MSINDYFQEYGPISRRRARNTAVMHRNPVTVTKPLSSTSVRPALHTLDLTDTAKTDVPTFSTSPARQRLKERRRARQLAQQRRFSPLRFALRALLIFTIVVMCIPYAVALYYRGQALPNIMVQGMPLGGANAKMIRDGLTARYADFLREPVTLTFEDQSWQPSLAQMGVDFDTRAMADQILQTGRHGDVLTRLREQWILWRHGIDIAPRLTIDQVRLQAYLQSLVPAIEAPPRDAALSVVAGNILGTPGQAGRQVLVDETAQDLLLALQTLTPQHIELRSRALAPTINDATLRAAQQQAEIFLSSPLVMTRGEANWTWHPETLAELLHIHPVGEELVVEIDPERLTHAVAQLAQMTDSDKREPRVRFGNGGVYIVQEGQQGWRLIQDEAAHLISTALQVRRRSNRIVALPFEEQHPRITAENLRELGITQLLAEGYSSFAGSAQYRITNIKVGATHTDGILIAPDEEFSFNTQVGDINAANGFVEGYAIIGNRTQLEWGGGICQNSTTIFRAAFWAGLPITERYAHPFYISWYDRFAFGPYGDGAGMDATIYTGVNDLKFVNDTGNWLLMETTVDEVNQILAVRLYGTNPGREVVLDGPYVSNEVLAPTTPVYIDDPGQPRGTIYQSDVARHGRDIVVYRAIVEQGVEVRRDSFFTRFKAWPNVFVRGTG